MSTYAICLLLIFFQTLLAMLRWKFVLKAYNININFSESFRIFFSGQLINQTVGFGVGGDILKSYLLFKFGGTLKSTFKLLIVDRLTALLSILLLCYVYIGYSRNEYINSNSYMISVFLSLLCIFTLIVIFVLVLLDNYHIDRIKFIAFSILSSLLGFLLCVLSAFTIVMTFFTDLHFSDFAAALLPSLLVASIPITVGGWGTRELSVIYFLSNLDIPNEISFFISICLGIFTLICSLPGLFFITRNSDEN